MTRQDLLAALAAYAPTTEEERVDRDCIAALVTDHPDCFYRHHFVPGHVTGSALLLSRDCARILLNHHKTLNKWLSFGGHADGEADILSVACRETEEESGITAVAPVSAAIFDVDVHVIPVNPARNEPEHSHFDIRYLLQVTGSEDFTVSAESESLRWCTFDEALAMGLSPGMRRLVEKARALSRCAA